MNLKICLLIVLFFFLTISHSGPVAAPALASVIPCVIVY